MTATPDYLHAFIDSDTWAQVVAYNEPSFDLSHYKYPKRPKKLIVKSRIRDRWFQQMRGDFMGKIPEMGFLRIKQIVGDKKANPPIPAIVPISKASWWAGVKSGLYPKPVKLGTKMTAWRVEDIKNLIANGPTRSDEVRATHENATATRIKNMRRGKQ